MKKLKELSIKVKIIASVIFVIMLIGFLEYTGYIWHNEFFARKFEVRGLDVSNYQKKIDWQAVPKEYKFVYIKATEGEDWTDKTFDYNWKNARENGFKTGAYHFYLSQNSGKEQADNFIKKVPKEISLPHVIDLEIDTDEDVSQIRDNLTEMVGMLEKHYGKKPVFYVNYETYTTYVSGGFKEYDIWIRDVVKFPELRGNKKWTFWQFCDRGRVKGFSEAVDINVFNGNKEEYDKFIY